MTDDHARHFEPPQPQSGVCSKVIQGAGQRGADELLLRRADEQVRTPRRDETRRPIGLPARNAAEAPALNDPFSPDPEVVRWPAGIGLHRRPEWMRERALQLRR